MWHILLYRYLETYFFNFQKLYATISLHFIVCTVKQGLLQQTHLKQIDSYLALLTYLISYQLILSSINYMHNYQMKLCFTAVIKNICTLKKEKKRISPSLGSSRSSGWLSLTSEHTDPSPIPESVRETCLRWWRSGEFLPASIWAFLTASRQMFSMTGM